MIVLIGSTTLTPCEAYVFKFPEVTKNHHSNYHKIRQETVVQCLRQFHEQIFQTNTAKVGKKSSNMFVLLKSQPADTMPKREELYLERYLADDVDEIISKCSKVFCADFQLKPNDENERNFLNCCNELIVFEDLSNLSVSQEPQKSPEEHVMDGCTTKTLAKMDWKLCKNKIRRYDCRKIRGKLVWEF